MKKSAMLTSAALTFCFTCLCLPLSGCRSKEQYSLTVTGSEYLYSNLQSTYRAGEEVAVKVKIKPYEGVKVLLDSEQLVQTKSTQNDFWLFTFEMPSRDATLDIQSSKGFDEPLLYGFYLTFNDRNGDPIESLSKPVDSEKAVADYAVLCYEGNLEYFKKNSGANVFADCKQKFSNVGYELEDTLYFTYELIDSVVCVEWVYLDKATQNIHSYGNDIGYKLDDLGGSFSTQISQNLSDTRYTSQMTEYEERFDSFVKVNFKYLDYLTGVKLLEYNANNELIRSAEIAKSENETARFVSDECEYAIIEEEYTVKTGTHSGETYCERTLINRHDSKNGGGKILKYPRGDGLISPVYLSVKWQTEAND